MLGKKTSLLNLTHDSPMSCKMGYIYPLTCFDVVPGDRIDHRISALIRTQPLLAPLMHTVDIDIHAYFVPDRLVWEDSEVFHAGGDDGEADPTPPYMTVGDDGLAVGSLQDYYRLPCDYLDSEGDPVKVPNYEYDARPIRGYGLIYNYHYRDKQLMPEVTVDLSGGEGGPDTTTSRILLRACWKRDYFTACRPNPQLGPEVSIPLTGDAEVYSSTTGGPSIKLRRDSNGNFPTGPSNLQVTGGDMAASGGDDLYIDPNGSLFADMEGVSAIDIRDLREASAVQRHLEFNNNFGTTYMEQLMARFGVHPQDARLQWPEFLGGGSAKIQFSEVLQTAEGTNPVGEMRGHGISLVGSERYKRYVPEHGFIHVLLIVRPKTMYSQGLHRMWSRKTRYDYLLPEFQDIGDQAVLNKELFVGHASPDGVFGYNQMYEEYRTIPSRFAGELRTTLNYWHMGREFASDPALNATFLACNPTDRVWPDGQSDWLYVFAKHKIYARRLLKKHSAYLLK